MVWQLRPLAGLPLSLLQVRLLTEAAGLKALPLQLRQQQGLLSEQVQWAWLPAELSEQHLRSQSGHVHRGQPADAAAALQAERHCLRQSLRWQARHLLAGRSAPL